MPKEGHYHCIECGSLFEAPVMDVRDQRCPVCGHPPTGKILAGAEQDRLATSVIRADDPKVQPARELHGISQDSQNIHAATLEAQKHKRRGRVKRTKRKERKSKKIWLMVCVWVALMTVTVGLIKYFNPDEEDEVVSANEQDAKRTRIELEAEAKRKRMFVSAASRECEKAMTAFLNASTAEAKAQYVYQGVELVGVMNRYYRNNPSFSSTRSQIMIRRGELLNVPDKKIIATVCQNSLGERFEVVYIQDSKEWKIDWKSLVRYDARPWSLFTSGSDGDEGEFRLYMRVRDMDEDLESQDMSVVFYKPGMYNKNDFSGLASKSVRVPIDSPQGRQIMQMLDADENTNQDAYGFTIGNQDPPGYHRVRVRMRLHKKEGEETEMELLDIIANHWYGEELVSPTQKDEP